MPRSRNISIFHNKKQHNDEISLKFSFSLTKCSLPPHKAIALSAQTFLKSFVGPQAAWQAREKSIWRENEEREGGRHAMVCFTHAFLSRARVSRAPYIFQAQATCTGSPSSRWERGSCCVIAVTAKI